MLMCDRNNITHSATQRYVLAQQPHQLHAWNEVCFVKLYLGVCPQHDRHHRLFSYARNEQYAAIALTVFEDDIALARSRQKK